MEAATHGNCQYINVHACTRSPLSIVINCLLRNDTVIGSIKIYGSHEKKKKIKGNNWFHYKF